MNISDFKFNPIIMQGTVPYNINRNVDILPEFDQIVPEYNENDGISLRLHENNNVTKVEIKKTVYEKFFYKMDNPSNRELMREYMNMKVDVVNHLVTKTYARGYEKPSPIQKLSIPALISGKDVLAQSKSGTGKTHGFLLGNLFHYDPNDEYLQHIFITSSHEVATQIYQEVKYLLPSNALIELCIGQKTQSSSGGFKSASKTRSNYQLINDISKAQVLVCTMGKFYDLYINRKLISTKFLKTICVDEFDAIVGSNNGRSSTKSTEEQMAEIIQSIPEFTQRSFFSATASIEPVEIAFKYFRNWYDMDDQPITDTNVDNRGPGEPLVILLDATDNTLDGIIQYYITLQNTDDKDGVLLDLLMNCRIAQLCVFANTINRVIGISEYINRHIKKGLPLIPCGVLHSDMTTVARNKIFEEFKNGTVRVLVATDIASRGVDVQGVGMVINYDMPNDLPTYIHRIGRSGRYGRKGIAINFVVSVEGNDEMEKINEINLVSVNSKIMPLPNSIANIAI